MAFGSDQYNIAIQVTASTAQAQANLERLAVTTGKLGASADPAAVALDDLSESVGGVDDAAVEAAEAAGGLSAAMPLLATAATIAITALAVLAEKLYNAYLEHKRLQDLAGRLDLPTDRVKEYSASWVKVIQNLRDVADGFDRLKSSQEAAFARLGVDPLNIDAIDQLKTRIAASSGNEREKINVWRVLFGVSPEDAQKQLKEELARLNKVVVDTRLESLQRDPATGDLYSPYATRAQIEGVQIGRENIRDVLGGAPLQTQLQLDEHKRLLDEDRRWVDQWDKDNQAALKSENDAWVDSLRVQVTAQKIYRDRQQEIDQEYFDWKKKEAERLESLTATEGEKADAALKERSEALNQQLIDGAISPELFMMRKDLIKSEMDDLLGYVQVTAKKVGDGVDPALVQLQKNIQTYFTDPLKEALDNFVERGKISGKRLLADLIASLLKRELYDAIDALGKALEDALNPKIGGGGGWIGGIVSFGRSLLGFAGGGVIDRPTIVGEGGSPELVLPGRDGATVLNMRQMAFAGAGKQQAGGEVVYHDNRRYEFNGTDTQMVLAHFEATRERDQRELTQRLKDNNFGRLR